MCGIAGVFSKNSSFDNITNIALSVKQKLRHRGPDANSTWKSNSTGLLLLHTRLSIIDLNETGNQPMTSFCGRYTIVFNGEIYNYLSLKNNLIYKEEISWKGTSDTEVFLNHISIYGLFETLKLSQGMFAFALWDSMANKLYLCRDRLGEKPLYYSMQSGILLFSSELKAILSSLSSIEISSEGLESYLQFGYTSAPYSILKNVFKVMPGTLIEMQLDNLPFLISSPITKHDSHLGCQEVAWWKLSEEIKLAQEKTILGFKDSFDHLTNILSESVKLQSLADVPIGLMLSGGVDSSLLAVLMRKVVNTDIRTYTIGFTNQTYDESNFAKLISNQIGSIHNELILTEDEITSFIDTIGDSLDEPFGDSSFIPNALLAKFISSDLKVALSGDGGDELFGGYNRYYWGLKTWDKIGYKPKFLQESLKLLLSKLTRKQVLGIEYLFNKLNQGYTGIYNLDGKIQNVLQALNSKDFSSFYLNTVKYWQITSLDASMSSGHSMAYRLSILSKFSNSIDQILYHDQMTYLPDDILFKTDRSSMLFSLETRLPFLDLNVLRASWSLSNNLKISENGGKILLKEILKAQIPNLDIERPKMGFGVPISNILREELKKKVCELINSLILDPRFQFNRNIILEELDLFLSGSDKGLKRIWSLIVLQSWLNSNINK